MIHSFVSTKIALALVTCLLLCFLIFSLTFSDKQKKPTDQPNESPAKPQGSGGDRQRGFGSAKWWVGWVGTPWGSFGRRPLFTRGWSPEAFLLVVVVVFFEDCRFLFTKVGKTCIFRRFFCFLIFCVFLSTVGSSLFQVTVGVCVSNSWQSTTPKKKKNIWYDGNYKYTLILKSRARQGVDVAP